MPSVIVNWRGRCRSRKQQSSLCLYLGEVAELSHRFYEEPPDVRYFDHTIEGRILLSDSLLEDTPVPADALEKVIIDDPEGEVELFLAKTVHLHGIEFHMYWPHHYLEDRVSFVFLSYDRFPMLNGKIVMVEDHDECLWYQAKKIREADWFLREPRIHLRYYLEGWFDNFLQFVKYFFVPDLYFWRYDDLPGCAESKHRLDMLSKERPRAVLRREVFNELLNRYRREVTEGQEPNND